MKVTITEAGKDLGKIEAGKATLVAGVLGGATNSDGEEVAKYAFFNEYGTEEIPSRPFMRNAVKKNQGKWEEMILQAIGSGMTYKQALEAIRNIVRADIMASIQNSTAFKELSPKTLKRKAKMADKGKMNPQYKDTPLIESTALIRSINTEIR